MKRLGIYAIFFTILFGLVAAGVFWLRLANPASAFPLQVVFGLNSLPMDGWVVCEDLGVGTLPGVPGVVQKMVMCNGNGWRILVYCIEPPKPAPPLNQICSMVNETDFWCGDTVQMFRLRQVLQTPEAVATAVPTATETPSPTMTPTPTPTETSTETPTFTPTPTFTASPLPTATELPSPEIVTPLSPGATQAAETPSTPTPEAKPQAETSSTPVTPTAAKPTAVKGANSTPTLEATPFKRPHAGGPGNLGFLLSIAAVLGGAGLLAAGMLLRVKNQNG